MSTSYVRASSQRVRGARCVRARPGRRGGTTRAAPRCRARAHGAVLPHARRPVVPSAPNPARGSGTRIGTPTRSLRTATRLVDVVLSVDTRYTSPRDRQGAGHRSRDRRRHASRSCAGPRAWTSPCGCSPSAAWLVEGVRDPASGARARDSPRALRPQLEIRGPALTDGGAGPSRGDRAHDLSQLRAARVCTPGALGPARRRSTAVRGSRRARERDTADRGRNARQGRVRGSGCGAARAVEQRRAGRVPRRAAAPAAIHARAIRKISRRPSSSWARQARRCALRSVSSSAAASRGPFGRLMGCRRRARAGARKPRTGGPRG